MSFCNLNPGNTILDQVQCHHLEIQEILFGGGWVLWETSLSDLFQQILIAYLIKLEPEFTYISHSPRNISIQFSSVGQSCQIFVTPWPATYQASLFITNPWSCSNSCLVSQYCHPTNSFSAIPFSSCLESIPGIRVFSNESDLCIRWLKFGASASVHPMNIQGWPPLGLTGLIFLQSSSL